MNQTADNETYITYQVQVRNYPDRSFMDYEVRSDLEGARKVKEDLMSVGTFEEREVRILKVTTVKIREVVE